MHPNSNAFRYFKGLVLVATLLALCVVSLGAYVRLTDAGLGCPDWPGCYGTLTVPQSEAAILQAQTTYPDSAVEVGKAWREMAHRYLAGTLGLLVLAIFVLGWKARKEIKVSGAATAGQEQPAGRRQREALRPPQVARWDRVIAGRTGRPAMNSRHASAEGLSAGCRRLVRFAAR